MQKYAEIMQGETDKAGRRILAMRMGALSEASGAPVPTIKFYLRQGLLHKGEMTSPNQSQYDSSHIHRIGLIRGLTEVGGLPLSTVAEIIAAMQDPEIDTHGVLGIVQRAASRQPVSAPETSRPQHRSDPGSETEDSMIDALMVKNGWDHPYNDVHRATAVLAVGTMRRLNLSYTELSLDSYAKAARLLAEVDLDGLGSAATRDQLIESVATTMIIGDVLVAALRRIAQTSLSLERYNGIPPVGPGDPDR